MPTLRAVTHSTDAYHTARCETRTPAARASVGCRSNFQPSHLKAGVRTVRVAQRHSPVSVAFARMPHRRIDSFAFYDAAVGVSGLAAVRQCAPTKDPHTAAFRTCGTFAINGAYSGAPIGRTSCSPTDVPTSRSRLRGRARVPDVAMEEPLPLHPLPDHDVLPAVE